MWSDGKVMVSTLKTVVGAAHSRKTCKHMLRVVKQLHGTFRCPYVKFGKQ